MNDDSKLSGSPSAAAGGSEAAGGVSGDIMRDAREALKVLEITGVMLESGPMTKVGALLLRVVKVISVELAAESPESAGDPPDVPRAAHSEADGPLVRLRRHVAYKLRKARRDLRYCERRGFKDVAWIDRGRIAELLDLAREVRKEPREAGQPPLNGADKRLGGSHAAT